MQTLDVEAKFLMKFVVVHLSPSFGKEMHLVQYIDNCSGQNKKQFFMASMNDKFQDWSK
jgi:hypothetical protein